MVINDSRRKVIFIHIPKCGGISVERTIHKELGGDDYIPYGQLITIRHTDGKGGLGLHSKMKDYRRYYINDIKDFYIFSIVRNPWRRMVSHYEYLVKQMYNKRIDPKDILDFNSFVQVFKTKIHAHTFLSYDEYFLDDKGNGPHFVGKLENIKNDLKIAGLGMKLEINEVLHMNKTDPKIKEFVNWKDYYKPWTRDFIYKIFKDDIEKYNYEFDE